VNDIESFTKKWDENYIKEFVGVLQQYTDNDLIMLEETYKQQQEVNDYFKKKYQVIKEENARRQKGSQKLNETFI